MDGVLLSAYLARLGVPRPIHADIAALRRLHLAHQRRIPFENLSISLGEPIALDQRAFVEKVAARGRGGVCYELNGAFAAMLAALGYRVTFLSARVYGQQGLGPPYDHLVLRADLDEPWLADVGFGSGAFASPLRLDVRAEQLDAHGAFRLLDVDGEIELRRDGHPVYRIGPRPQPLAAFAGMCRYHQTSPDSPFTQGTVCSLARPGGRISIVGRTLRRTRNGRATDEPLRTDAALRDAYRTHFGITLERLPGR